MKGLKTATDIAALLRARNHLIWVVTREETRVERYLVEAAAAADYEPRTWDCGAGFCDMGGKVLDDGARDIDEALGTIQSMARTPDLGDTTQGRRILWILRDLPEWLKSPVTLRKVRNLANTLPRSDADRRQVLVILSPRSDVPAELSDRCMVVDFPLPDREEIADIIDAQNNRVAPEKRAAIALTNGARESAIDAAVGLSAVEAESCCAKSLVEVKRIDPLVIGGEKKRIIAKSGTLRWLDPLPGGLANVGGLDGIKSWLLGRGGAYTKAAREYGLPAPRGVFVVGVSGCGKSLIAKSLASHYGIPLLQGDLGALKGKFVGESEANFRAMIKTVDAIGRCVLWLDEIEKSLAGGVDGGADAGVSADQIGQFLQWMQERTSEAFVVATANDVTKLPPEMLRKGRFDELFWVDVPNAVERAEVIKAALVANKRKVEWSAADLAPIVRATEGFTGAEIAALVPDAMFGAFNDGGREIIPGDLITAAANVVPLTKTAETKITAMRQWAKGRARPASLAIAATAEKRVSELDV